LLELSLRCGELLLALGERILQRAHLRLLCTRRIDSGRTAGGLLLDLLHARGEVVRLCRQFELATVEVTRPRGELAVGASRRSELGLALREQVLASLDLR